MFSYLWPFFLYKINDVIFYVTLNDDLIVASDWSTTSELLTKRFSCFLYIDFWRWNLRYNFYILMTLILTLNPNLSANLNPNPLITGLRALHSTRLIVEGNEGICRKKLEWIFYTFLRPNQQQLLRMRLSALWRESNLWPCDSGAVL
jgi:hypothetical protein